MAKTQFPIGKASWKLDPRGAHVTLRWRGQELLGEVKGCYRSPVTGALHLQVRYFNGEPWPVEPTHGAVEVLVRTYDTPEADYTVSLTDPRRM